MSQGCKGIEHRVVQKVPDVAGQVGKGLEKEIGKWSTQKVGGGISIWQLRSYSQKLKEPPQGHSQSEARIQALEEC